MAFLMHSFLTIAMSTYTEIAIHIWVFTARKALPLCMGNHKRILRRMPSRRHSPGGGDLYSDMGKQGRQFSSPFAWIGFKGHF